MNIPPTPVASFPCPAISSSLTSLLSLLLPPSINQGSPWASGFLQLLSLAVDSLLLLFLPPPPPPSTLYLSKPAPSWRPLSSSFFSLSLEVDHNGH